MLRTNVCSVGFIIVVAFVTASIGGCSGACSYETLETKPSPGGRYSAKFSKKDCGATTGFAYEVELARGLGAAKWREVVLRFDDGRQAEWPDDSEIADLTWLGKDRLVISASPKVRIFKKKTSFLGVDVEYRLSELPR